MSRTHLLGAASAAALAFSTAAFAVGPTATVTGGGSSLVSGDIGKVGTTNTELNSYGDANFTFVSSGSGSGRNAFITDNQNCNISNVGGYPAACTAGGATVQYGNTDAPYGTTELAAIATKTNTATRQVNTTFGNVIEVPFLGTAVAIPTVNALVTKNGVATLTDADICGIFSGKFTNWSQTSAHAKLTAGTITVLYRTDSSGTTNLFTNHLHAVCTATNSNFIIPVGQTGPNVTSTFATDLTAVPLNFVGQSGSKAIASYMSSLDPTACTAIGPITSAIGYLSPDFTAIATKSAATLCNGAHSALFVAAVNGKQPSTLNTTTALTSIDTTWAGNTNLTPPANATDAANALLWIPTIQKVSAGYPIVGYTDIVVAQCYKTATVASALTGFYAKHYGTYPNGPVAPYSKTIANNGFVVLPTALRNAVQTYILPPTGSLTDQGTEISSPTGCVGYTGRD